MKTDRTRLLGQPPMIPQVCKGEGIPGMVSVLIPTYNRAYSIAAAIDSVLAQTYRNIEIVIVDDGSTDDTRERIARFGDAVRYIYQPNAGLAAARNTGLAVARGEFIALQDSDDQWLPWKLEAQLAVMAVDSNIALSWTDMTAVDPAGQILHERSLRPVYEVYRRIRLEDHLDRRGTLGNVWPGCPEKLKDTVYHYGDAYSAMFLGNMVHPPTALMRRTHVAKAGGLDATYSWTCEDYEFFWRVCALGMAALVDGPGMLYRVGAADQLTQPGLLVYMARGNLHAIRYRLRNERQRIRLPLETIKDHLADAYQWLASEELQAKQGRWTTALLSLLNRLWLRPPQKATLKLLAKLILSRPYALASQLKQRLDRQRLTRT